MLLKKADIKQFDVVQFNFTNLLDKDIDVSLFNTNSIFEAQKAVDYRNTSYTYPVTTNTYGIAYGSYTDQIFAINANGAAYFLDVVNPYTNTVITRNALVGIFNAIHYDSTLNVLWLWNGNSNNVCKFDIASSTPTYYTINNHGIAVITTLYTVDNQLILFGRFGAVQQFLALDSTSITELNYTVINFVVPTYGVVYDGSEYLWIPTNIFASKRLVRISILSYTGVTFVTGIYQGNALVIKDNYIYAADKLTPNIYKYDIANNSISVIPLATYSAISRMALLGDIIYAVGNIPAPNTNILYSVSTKTDSAISEIPYSVAGNLPYLTIEDVKKSVYVSSGVKMFEYAVDNSFITVGSSVDYQMFLNILYNEPKRVVRIYLSTDTQSELNNVLQFVKKDANGQQYFYPVLPSIYIKKDQYQSNLAQLDFKKEIDLGLNCYASSYIIKANSTAEFVLYYRKFSFAEALSHSAVKLITDVPTDNPNKVSEREIHDQSISVNVALVPFSYELNNQTQTILVDELQYNQLMDNIKLKKQENDTQN